MKIATRILFIFIAAWAFQAFASVEEDCHKLVKLAVVERQSCEINFWKDYDRPCYNALNSKNSKLRKRLEAEDFKVYIADYRHFQCVDYCDSAIVSWDEKKSLGLTKKQRETKAKEYIQEMAKDGEACVVGQYIMLSNNFGGKDTKEEADKRAAACLSSRKNKLKTIPDCIRKSGNVRACELVYYKNFDVKK